MCMADKFPESLPGFQKMFPDDAACAKYLEAIRWRDNFKCPKCDAEDAPFRFLFKIADLKRTIMASMQATRVLLAAVLPETQVYFGACPQ